MQSPFSTVAFAVEIRYLFILQTGQGLLTGLTVVDDLYELSADPELMLRTDREEISQPVVRLTGFLTFRRLIAPTPGRGTRVS